ncbi:DNA-3-methyladenine glycosylase II [Staphylococcus aureus]|nr:DNA-3-methyladenine glycosylase II [Staphylococcus aureus]
MDFVNNDTRQIAKNLLGVKVIYRIPLKRIQATSWKRKLT